MLDELNSYTLIVATMKLVAITLILVMIAKNRNEVALDDPFFESQPWTLRDAYKVIIPPLLVIYVQVLLLCTVVRGFNYAWLITVWLTSIICDIGAVVLYFQYIYKPYKPTWSTFGLDKTKFLVSGVRHLNIAGAIGIFVLVLELAVGKPSAATGDSASVGMMPFRAGFLFLLFMAVISGPILEELLFRAVLYTPVARRLGSWKAMALLALVFDLYHLYFDIKGIPLYLGFFLLYYAYTRSRSLWVPIIWHIIVNFLHFKPHIAIVLKPFVSGATLNRCYLYTAISGLIIVNVWRHLYFRRTGLTREVLATMKLQRHPEDFGVFVRDVAPGSAAEKAGIRKGDVIVQYNGRRWLTTNRLDDLLTASATERRRMHVVFARNGIEHEVEVRPGALGVTAINQTAIPSRSDVEPNEAA